MERRRLAGVALLIVSACGFGSGTILAKPVYAAGMDWLGVLAWRFLLGSLLGWAWLGLSTALGRQGLRAVRSLARPQLLAALALGVLFTANSGTYYAGLETVPASLAGLIVYIYPVLVAVLSLRFGKPLSGARPWLALAVASVGCRAGRGRHRSAKRAPAAGHCSGDPVTDHLRALDHPVAAPRR